MLKQLLAAAVIMLWCHLTPVAAGELSIKVSSFPPGQPLKPGTAVLLSVEGLEPGQTATWHRVAGEGDGDDVNPPIPPLPPKVAGVLILEEQRDRTSAQRKIMDDPVWQAAAIAKGLRYEIRDDDNPSVAKHLAAAGSVRPVVCYIDSDDKVIGSEPLPETVEKMRALIGGVK